MNGSSADTSIADWVAENPSRCRIFERLGIDYCCRGKRTLSEACSEKGLNMEEVLQELRTAEAVNGEVESTAWRTRPLAELIQHIEEVHHVYLRRELPRLAEMSAKVIEVHAKNHPELAEIKALFDALKAELESHMMKEERILFPLVRQLEGSPGRPDFHCGSIGNPIQVMEFEHDEAGRALARLRQLSSDYTPPEEACSTYTALMKGLEQLERDLHQHIHEENNILFPKSVELESQLGS